jgi:hypothetical protein
MSMKRVALTLAAAVLLGGTPAQAAADDIAVILNKSNAITTLTMIELRKIIMGQETKWPGGGKIIVWMTFPGQPERVATLKIVCGMSESDLTLHFMHASFKGDSGDPPKALLSGALVRHSIATTSDGVGFILASQVDDSVKVVTIDGNRPGEAAYKLKLK